MSVYLVFTREKTRDAEELEIYNQQVLSTLKGHSVKIHALYGKQENLEGAASEGTVITEFPSAAAALAWYNGPEYRKVREHRYKGADFRVTLVEGV